MPRGSGRSPQLVIITGEGRKTGKTSFGAELVSKLRAAGLRVVVVKHVHHGVDYRVRDTGRYLEAGAEAVAALGPGEYMIAGRRSLSLTEALGLLALHAEADVVVVEGLRSEASRVIEQGGCLVYLCRSGCARLAVDGRLWELSRPEALEALIEALAEGGCTLRAPRPGSPST